MLLDFIQKITAGTHADRALEAKLQGKSKYFPVRKAPAYVPRDRGLNARGRKTEKPSS